MSRFSKSGTAEEQTVLFVGAVAQHALDPGSVVPGPIEQDNLAG